MSIGCDNITDLYVLCVLFVEIVKFFSVKMGWIVVLSKLYTKFWINEIFSKLIDKFGLLYHFAVVDSSVVGVNDVPPFSPSKP